MVPEKKFKNYRYAKELIVEEVKVEDAREAL